MTSTINFPLQLMRIITHIFKFFPASRSPVLRHRGFTATVITWRRGTVWIFIKWLCINIGECVAVVVGEAVTERRTLLHRTTPPPRAEQHSKASRHTHTGTHPHRYTHGGGGGGAGVGDVRHDAWVWRPWAAVITWRYTTSITDHNYLLFTN